MKRFTLKSNRGRHFTGFIYIALIHHNSYRRSLSILVQPKPKKAVSNRCKEQSDGLLPRPMKAMGSETERRRRAEKEIPWKKTLTSIAHLSQRRNKRNLNSFYEYSFCLEKKYVTVCFADVCLCSVQEDDSGSYFCRASNIPLHRFVTSRKASLTVQGTTHLLSHVTGLHDCTADDDPRTFSAAPPTVKMWPPALTVPLGARVELRCEVSGQPLPSISWVKRGQSKQTGGKITLGYEHHEE